MNKEKLETVLHDLNTVGYHKVNVVDLLDDEGVETYNQVSGFFEEMLNNPKIQYRLETIKKGLNIVNKDKYYEITHQEHLNRALSLTDGGLFKFYMNDFFTQLAEQFLETSTPYLYNVLFFLHGQGLNNRSGSQKWHRDLEDLKMLKIFMYCTDVTVETGALEYVPHSYAGGDFPLNAGAKTMADYQSTRVLNDEQEAICNERKVTFVGQPGDIMLCNNSGFHRGGFLSQGFRCMTHALYLRPDAIHAPPNVNYDHQVNFVDVNSAEYKSLGDKQKYLRI